MAGVLAQYRVTIVYHLAALLSAKGEQQPDLAWRVNMEGLRNVLEACRLAGVSRLFWPSTIAVFGPDTPRQQTPQHTVMNPTTLYGVTKLAGEQLCAWYHRRYGLDVRSLRYPGLISYTAPPGGGTTDYAVEIFHQALAHNRYTCFLEPNAALPMLYMPDAVRATLELMQAPAGAIRIRTSYNLGGLSFTPAELADAIRQNRPEFEIDYAPDFRQQIAQSWPASLDDSDAQTDWGWKPEFDLSSMTLDMLTQLAARQQLVPA
jgi:nucleoside-diphosphate-sugar epimerase